MAKPMLSPTTAGVSRRGGLGGQCQRGQAGRGAPDGGLVEEIRSRVRVGRVVEVRGTGCGGRGDVAQRDLVCDDERDLFPPGQQAPQGVRVAPQRVVDALAMGQAVARGVPVHPGPVRLDGRAVEVPGADLIEAGFDQGGHRSAGQGEVDGLLGAEQARADCEIDVEAGELRAEGSCLRSPSLGQRDGLGRVGAEHVGGVRRRFGMPRKDEQAEHVSRHRRPPSPGTQGIRKSSGTRWIVRGGGRARLGVHPKLAAITVSGCHLILVICDVA